MRIDHSLAGCVSLTMPEYIDGVVSKTQLSGTSTTPATSHLFNINPNAPLLSTINTVTYHYLVTKLLYLTKHTCPDLLLAVSFLTHMSNHLMRMISKNWVDASDTSMTQNILL